MKDKEKPQSEIALTFRTKNTVCAAQTDRTIKRKRRVPIFLVPLVCVLWFLGWFMACAVDQKRRVTAK